MISDYFSPGNKNKSRIDTSKVIEKNSENSIKKKISKKNKNSVEKKNLKTNFLFDKYLKKEKPNIDNQLNDLQSSKKHGSYEAQNQLKNENNKQNGNQIIEEINIL